MSIHLPVCPSCLESEIKNVKSLNVQIQWKYSHCKCIAVRSRRLRFFGHICRADRSQDHSWNCTPVCPSTGGEDPAGRDRPGYELSRMIYGHSIWVWWQLNGVGQNRTAWQTLFEMATLLTSSRWWWWWWWWWNVSGGVAFLSRKVKGHIVIRQEKEWKHVVNQFTVNNLWW